MAHRWRVLLLVLAVLVAVPAAAVHADVRAELAEAAEGVADDDEVARTRVIELQRAPAPALAVSASRRLELPMASLGRVFRPPRVSSV